MRASLLLLLAACGGPAGAPAAIDNRAPDAPEGERDCWLGDDRCTLDADLDGDGRDDRVELIRVDAQRGLRITLAGGDVVYAGAGHAHDALAIDPELEPLPIDADLAYIVAFRVRAGAPPCPAQAIEMSGEDAAAQLCVLDGVPRLFHLGF